MSKVKKHQRIGLKARNQDMASHIKKKDMIKGFVFSEQLPQRGGTFVKIRHWPL